MLGRLEQIARWRYGRLAAKVRISTTGGETELDLKKEKLRQDIRAKKLRSDAAAGHLIERDVAVQELATLLSTVKARLQAVPVECSLEISQTERPTVTRTLRRKVDLVLREMATTQLVGQSADDVILGEASKILARRAEQAAAVAVEEAAA